MKKIYLLIALLFIVNLSFGMEHKKAKLAFKYIAFFHKHIKYGGDKNHRANYRACQQFLNVYMQKEYGAILSDSEDLDDNISLAVNHSECSSLRSSNHSHQNDPIIPKYLFKSDTNDHCPTPSISLSSSEEYPTSIFSSDFEKNLDPDGVQTLDGKYF